MFAKRSKLQIVLEAIALESVSRRLAESRNRAPAIGGTYGTYGFSQGGWTR